MKWNELKDELTSFVQKTSHIDGVPQMTPTRRCKVPRQFDRTNND